MGEWANRATEWAIRLPPFCGSVRQESRFRAEAMFSLLSDRLEGVFKKLRGLGKISESNVQDAMREVRMALLEADVDFNVAKAFIESVKERALGVEVLKSVTPGQQIVKIFHDELAALLGGDAAELKLDAPGYILICGLNGAGKTTTSAKLARLLKKQGKRPVLVALDLYRPAAIQQLATLAGEIDVPLFAPPAGETDVVKMAKAALAWIATQGANVAIFDTAGRQEIDEALVGELKQVRDLIQPGEVLLVADAATGQQAVSVATHFHSAVGLTGLILTKLDGDARGGAALSMRAVTQQPIKFIGMGEKLDQLDIFVPQRLADRMLGMGDIVGLVEKAAEAIDEKDAMKMLERFGSGSFDFTDLLNQMKFMRKLGPLEGLLSMMPGMSQLKDLKVDDKRLKQTEAVVLSMTPEERKRPEIINAKRRQRIANGSGTPVAMLVSMLEQIKMMKSLMSNQGQMGKMMKMMGGKGGMPGLGDLAGMLGGMGGGGKGGMPPGFPDLGSLMGGMGGNLGGGGPAGAKPHPLAAKLKFPRGGRR
jgi:signal recognition particle subunit SRP54